MAAVTLEVRASGGDATTIAAAIDLIPASTNDDYTIFDYRENGAQATNDSPWSTSTDSVTFGVAGSLLIAGAPGNEYSYWTETGANCVAFKNNDACFDVGNCDKVTIRDIKLANATTLNARAVDFKSTNLPSSPRVVMERVVGEGIGGTFTRAFNTIQDNICFSHCIALNCTSRGFSVNGATDVFLINCMSINCARGVDCSASNARLRVINHVYWNCTDDENGTVHVDSTRNASSNGSPQGTSPYVPALTAADFVDSANYDFHLAPAGALAAEAGADRSADGITQDYDRETISTWRIGVDTLAGNSAPVVDINTGYHIYEGKSRIIRPENLTSSDPDDDAFNYIFDGVFLGGSLSSDIIVTNNGVIQSVNDTFTQANVDANLISADAENALAGNYELRFRLDDGTDQSAVVAFNIEVRVDPYDVADNTLIKFPNTSIKDDFATQDYPGNSPRGGQFAFSGGLFIAWLNALLQWAGGHGDTGAFLPWAYDIINHFWYKLDSHSPDIVENASPTAQGGNNQGFYDDSLIGGAGDFAWDASRHTYNGDKFAWEEGGKSYIGFIRQASTYSTSGTYNYIGVYNETDNIWISSANNQTRAASPLPDNIYGGFSDTLSSDNSQWWGILTGTVVYSYDYIADTWKTHSVTGMAKAGVLNDRYTSRIIDGKIWCIGQGVFGYIDISAGHANNATLTFVDVAQSGDTSIFGTDAPMLIQMLDGDFLAYRGSNFYRITQAGNASTIALSGGSVAAPALGTNDMLYKGAFRVPNISKEAYAFHPGDRFTAGDAMHVIVIADNPTPDMYLDVEAA